MARIRSIHPSFWDDEEVQTWDPWTRLAFIQLWGIADDSGRFRAHPNLLRSQILPFDDCDKDAALARLVASGKVVLYEVAGQRYGVVRRFRRWQRPQKPTPSRLPPPPGADPADDESDPVPTTVAATVPTTVAATVPTTVATPESLPYPSGTGVGVGVGEEGEGARAPVPERTPTRAREEPPPPPPADSPTERTDPDGPTEDAPVGLDPGGRQWVEGALADRRDRLWSEYNRLGRESGPWHDRQPGPWLGNCAVLAARFTDADLDLVLSWAARAADVRQGRGRDGGALDLYAQPTFVLGPRGGSSQAIVAKFDGLLARARAATQPQAVAGKPWARAYGLDELSDLALEATQPPGWQAELARRRAAASSGPEATAPLPQAESRNTDAVAARRLGVVA